MKKMSIPATVLDNDGNEYAVVTVTIPHPLTRLEGSLVSVVDTAVRIWAQEHDMNWYPDDEEVFDDTR